MIEERTIVERVNKLAGSWRGRLVSMKKHYRLLSLYNDLYQENMESVISSDPRTGFNMALWLLQPRTSNFIVETDGLTVGQTREVNRIEAYADQQLKSANRSSRGSLHGKFIRRLLSFMLSTGWYAVISLPTEHGWLFRVWNPASCYPEYNAEGQLVELGRSYKVTASEANRKVESEEWAKPSVPFVGNPVVYSLWRMRGPVVTFAAVVGNHLAQPEVAIPFSRIPVFTAPVAGLPDDGSIMQTEQWRAEIGQSILAPIYDVQKNYDKMLTYLQQLLRDTANPRWKFHTQGTEIKPDDLFKRGALFEMGPEEDLKPVEMPPIPPELRAHQFDLRSQLQRGLFSDISFGTVTQNVSGFLMSQVTAAAAQIMTPFRDGLKDVLGDIATSNIRYMREFNELVGQKVFTLGGEPFPRLPMDLPIDFHYEIQIPGDFMQRANSARVLNPNFKVSSVTLANILFPEIKDPMKELGLVRAEDATHSPTFLLINQIEEFYNAAQEARENNDEEYARRLEDAARLLEGQLGAKPTAQPDTLEASQTNLSGAPRDVQELFQGEPR